MRQSQYIKAHTGVAAQRQALALFLFSAVADT